MSRRVADLARQLEEAGFEPRPGKGSHFVWTHPKGVSVVLTMNHQGKDAGPSAAHHVERAIRRVQ